MFFARFLNPIGCGCPNFSMNWDALLFWPVLIVGTRDVPRHLDQDASGTSCLDTWDLSVPWDVLSGLKSLVLWHMRCFDLTPLLWDVHGLVKWKSVFLLILFVLLKFQTWSISMLHPYPQFHLLFLYSPLTPSNHGDQSLLPILRDSNGLGMGQVRSTSTCTHLIIENFIPLPTPYPS